MAVAQVFLIQPNIYRKYLMSEYEPPSTIRLPSGRVVRVEDLIAQANRGIERYNLRTGYNTAISHRATKYTLEEREWQAASTLAEIQRRYQVTTPQARSIKWQARKILDKLDLDTSTAR